MGALTESVPSKYEALAQCWADVGPISARNFTNASCLLGYCVNFDLLLSQANITTIMII